ncbi:MAG: hypothetical protein U0R44_00535 [Candidatus Micrarchaeia archaeon]
MAAQRSKERIDEAQQSVQSLVHEHQAKIITMVPVRTGRRRTDEELARIIEAASGSLRVLERQSFSVGRMLGTTIARSMLEYGSYAPPRVFRTPDEARRHSQELLLATLPLVDINSPSFSLAPRPAGAPLTPLYPHVENRTIDEESVRVRGWLTAGFLGPAIHERFIRTPPVVTVESESYFATLNASEKTAVRAVGKYYHDTNHIMICEEIARYDEPTRMVLLIHEQLHYASYLGGGRSIRWRGGSGEQVVAPTADSDWLHEGLTQYFSLRLAHEHGYYPSETFYMDGVRVGFFLSRIVGDDALKTAFLTGDFTAVRNAVDSRLGAGTFGRLMSSGRAPEASVLLSDRVEQKFTEAERRPWSGDRIHQLVFARPDMKAMLDAMSALRP